MGRLVGFVQHGYLDGARGVAVRAVVVVVAGEDELRLPAVQERGGHVGTEHVDVLVPGPRGQRWIASPGPAPGQCTVGRAVLLGGVVMA